MTSKPIGHPVPFERVFIQSQGVFLPGPAISNKAMDAFIEPLNGFSKRIKRRILQENGIRSRHYALDAKGRTRYSAARMGAEAARACLSNAGLPLNRVSLLCTGTSGGDTAMPGFANMLQGELSAPPMETSSHHGICSAGLSAFMYAAMSVEQRRHERALVVSSEFPSRMFKKTRFAPAGYKVDFDAHFLRWMLSDGAGAWLVGNQPHSKGLSLRLKWLHLKSFSGEFPVCMQTGFPKENRPKSYLDYPSFAEAEKDGAFLLRQDLRLLPHLFDLGIHEYARLVQAGYVSPAAIDHFLCHYSSEKFAPVIQDLLEKARLDIPKSKWFSNLKTRGNTGAASIFIMLEEFLRMRRVKAGETILCFVPESGRFTAAYALFEVVGPGAPALPAIVEPALPEPPQPAEDSANAQLSRVLRDLADVWHDFRTRFFQTPFVRKIMRQELTRANYLAWMACWIPQVREGSVWMREAAANLAAPYPLLRAMIEHHAGQEQFDFKVLFKDYRAAGGTAASIDALERNPGGEALNAFMHHRAAQKNAVDLLGGIYIIEGTGSRIIPTLLPLLRRQLPFSSEMYRFLRYHGENDENHLTEWRQAVQYVLDQSPDGEAAAGIVRTARITAELYLLQMEHVR